MKIPVKHYINTDHLTVGEFHELMDRGAKTEELSGVIYVVEVWA